MSRRRCTDFQATAGRRRRRRRATAPRRAGPRSRTAGAHRTGQVGDHDLECRCPAVSYQLSIQASGRARAVRARARARRSDARRAPCTATCAPCGARRGRALGDHDPGGRRRSPAAPPPAVHADHGLIAASAPWPPASAVRRLGRQQPRRARAGPWRAASSNPHASAVANADSSRPPGQRQQRAHRRAGEARRRPSVGRAACRSATLTSRAELQHGALPAAAPVSSARSLP